MYSDGRFGRGWCSMLEIDDARELLAAADRDLSALRGMEDTTVFADEIAGFHAQQAAEKFFKVWLILQGVEYPRTHSLAQLIGLIERRDNSVAMFRELNEYTPYAVQFRYDAMEMDLELLDRQQAVQRLEYLRTHVYRQLGEI